MKVAIVYDYMTQFGGAERVVRILHQAFPDAPIHTVVYNPKVFPADFGSMDIRTSFINRLPLSHRCFELYIPFYGFAVEQFDLRGYDVVISVSTMVAKGVLTGPRTCHISICFTPMRWAWDLYQNYIDELRGRWFFRQGFRLATHYYRTWDLASADRVNYFVTGSRVAARRIRKHYNRDADVIHPPIEYERFRPTGKPPEEFYLVVSRLVLAKRVDLAVRAFAALGKPLVVIGTGERLPHLQRIATPNITFLGFQPDEVVNDHMARCRALILTGEEDSPLTPVEAHASGRPVVAFAAGGALETIEDGVTGVFFREPTPESLANAVRRFETLSFDGAAMTAHAEPFGPTHFIRRIREYAERRHREYIESIYG